MSSSPYMRPGVKKAGYVGVQVKNANLTVRKQGPEMQTTFDKIKKANDNEAGKIFAKEILPM